MSDITLYRQSKRKSVLIACATIQHVKLELTPFLKKAIYTLVEYLDKKINKNEMMRYKLAVSNIASGNMGNACARSLYEIYRCFFSNDLDKIQALPVFTYTEIQYAYHKYDDEYELFKHRFYRVAEDIVVSDTFTGISDSILQANDKAAFLLAQSIYNDKEHSLMPILGDALEDAGCIDSFVLGHCKSGFHVHGCWLLDKILKKE